MDPPNMQTVPYKPYQFRLYEPECHLIHELRAKQQEIKFESALQSNLLKRTLHVQVNSGDRRVGTYDVDAASAPTEFASLGLRVQREILANDWDGSNAEDDVEEHGPVLHSHDTDRSECEDDSFASWELVKEELVPSYVKRITFEVDEAEIKPHQHDEIRERFPGVFIKSNFPAMDQSTETITTEVIPKGVKSAVFELDQAEVKKDPKLAGEISARFPWASIENKATTLPSMQRSPHPDRESAPQYQNGTLNPPTRTLTSQAPTLSSLLSLTNEPNVPESIHYILDMARCLTQAPAHDEFGYRFQISQGWNTLPILEKAAIAHARCIQGQYGVAVDRSAECTHCAKHGYSCRVYRPSIIPPTGVSTYECQNCRVWGQACSLTRPQAKSSEATPTALATSGRIILLSGDEPSHSTPNFPRLYPSKRPTLVERMTKHDDDYDQEEDGMDDVQFKGAAIRKDDDRTWDESPFSTHMSDSPLPMPDTPLPMQDTPITVSLGSEVYAVARRIGLRMTRPDVVQSMYTYWLQRHIVLGRGKLRLDYFYSNLVDLCIVGRHTNDVALQEAVLKKFQQTNYQFIRGMPEIDVPIKAFQYLSHDSSLCQWITILFAFLWDTAKHGDYNKLRNELKTASVDAIAAFLYNVARIRCPFTQGHDAEVLSRWCDFHNHVRGGSEERKCKEWRDNISKKSLAVELATIQENEFTEAKSLINKRGGKVVMKDGIGTPSRTSIQMGKRKADTSPATEFSKKNRIGGGYDYGR